LPHSAASFKVGPRQVDFAAALLYRECVKFAATLSGVLVVGCASGSSPQLERAELPARRGTVACAGGELEFERGCASAADCALASGYLDCCGTLRIVGIARSEQERVTRAAQECLPQGGLCECLAGPARLDSGESSHDAATVSVACEAGRCVSRLSPGVAPPRPAQTER
jgi:hypothetical protein